MQPHFNNGCALLEVSLASEALLEVPHPRLAERAFVLVPLAEIAATWIDPLSGRSVAEQAAALPAELKGGDALATLEPKGPHSAVGRLSRLP